jgi:hypothetical protein
MHCFESKKQNHCDNFAGFVVNGGNPGSDGVFLPFLQWLVELTFEVRGARSASLLFGVTWF